MTDFKFTAVYTVSIQQGSHTNILVNSIKFEQREGESVLGAMNRAGYEAGKEWDIADSVVMVFKGHCEQV